MNPQANQTPDLHNIVPSPVDRSFVSIQVKEGTEILTEFTNLAELSQEQLYALNKRQDTFNQTIQEAQL